jgi:hypothetical protein
LVCSLLDFVLAPPALGSMTWNPKKVADGTRVTPASQLVSLLRTSLSVFKSKTAEPDLSLSR